MVSGEVDNDQIAIRESQHSDAPLITSLMDQYWGGEPLVVRGEEFFPSRLPGFIAFAGEKVAGFIFYYVEGSTAEVVVFESFEKFQGLGTQLLERVRTKLTSDGIKRVFLTTHNDNLDALRFYQKRGFHICAIHLNTMPEARRKKPSIPELGDYGIPIRDEIDLEMHL